LPRHRRNIEILHSFFGQVIAGHGLRVSPLQTVYLCLVQQLKQIFVRVDGPFARAFDLYAVQRRVKVALSVGGVERCHLVPLLERRAAG
jgi:hypothetical protein